jgi:enoyl-CoA hydratase
MHSTPQSFFSRIRIERRSRVTLLTVDRPDKLNAIDRATLEELASATIAFLEDPEQAALVVTGAGAKAFVAGADIAELQPMGPAAAESLSRFGQSVFDRWEQSPKPVLAAVNGYAFGGGCELALACHVRLASENAVLGLPEVKLGLIPGYGGTQRLPRLVGAGRALELILTGRPVKADEAERIGLVNRVVPLADLVGETIRLAESMIANGPIALASAIECVHRGMSSSLDQGLRLESSRFGFLASTEDMHEGLQAFLEKRTAAFRNR